MSEDIIMPQMGESVAEGTIIRWLVEEGERVGKEQSLVEISTDKVDTEVPSPLSGVIKKIIHREEETVPVGTVIAVMEEVEGGVGYQEAPRSKSPVEPTKKAAEEKESGEKRSSPLVRRLAGEYGIDLKTIDGSGAGGRITRQDMLDYIERTQKVAIPTGPEVEATEKEEEAEEEEIIPLSSKRRIIAERMVQSKVTAPHVTTTFEVDLTRIAGYREANKDTLLKSQEVHLTYLPFIISAVSRALREYPIFNSSLTEKGILIKKYVNIGIAVSLDDGLIVPVIKGVDGKGLIELARESRDLALRAREKKLRIEEVQDGTFTITNYGIAGSLFGTPIILLPQVAILGIGAVTKRPVIINDAIAIRYMAYLSLSFDHRVVDGAQADQFLSTIKDVLEKWGDKLEKMPAAESGFGGVW